MKPGCWLIREDGTRLRVDGRGVLLGRASGNDVIVSDPATSSVHALVRLGPTGPEILSFGRNPSLVNEVRVSGSRSLADGDRVALPGESFVLRLAGEAVSGTEMTWRVYGPQDRPYGVHRTPMTFGGGPEDDLFIPGLPAGAARASLAQGALVLELGIDAEISGRPVAAGDMHTSDVEDVVVLGGTRLRIVGEPAQGGMSTEIRGPTPLPTTVRFEFLPSGGQLDLTFPRGKVSLRLAEIRARLVATLLSRDGELGPGDWYPDDLLIPKVWPRADNRTRVNVNILVHRVRQDLLKAGVNPFAVLERVDRATRLCLAPGAAVEVV